MDFVDHTVRAATISLPRLAATAFAVAVLVALSPRVLAEHPTETEEEQSQSSETSQNATSQPDSQAAESSSQEAPKTADDEKKVPKENVDVKAKKDKNGKPEKVCWQERALGSPFLKKVCRTKEEVAVTEKSAKGAMRDMRRTTGSEQGN